VPRKAPVQERAAATVTAILDAVEQHLEKSGERGLNTNRVAELAGVSIGTLYQYYPNKEALVGAVQERYLSRTLAFCRAVLAGAATVPIAVAIERTADALVAAYRTQRPIQRWLNDLRSAAAFQEQYRAMLEQFVDELAAFLAARPDVRFPDAHAAAYVLVHGIHGIGNAAGIRTRELDVEAVAAAARTMVTAYTDRLRTTCP
jgi:AcrR family transcriptional regulator